MTYDRPPISSAATRQPTETASQRNALISDVRGMEFVEKLVAFLFVVIAVVGLVFLAKAVKEKYDEQGNTVRGLDSKIEVGN